MLSRGEKVKETILLLILNIILPTADVYSDLALIINLLLIGTQDFAVMLIIPFSLSYLVSWVKMWQLDRCRVLAVLAAMMSCYPQYLAIRVIVLIWVDPEKGLHSKRRLEREVAEVEVFVEAVPSVFVMTFFIQFDYNQEAETLLQMLVFGMGIKRFLFFITYSTSIVTASLGMAKCLKIGPCRILPEGGAVGGLCTGRFLLILFSVAITLVSKIILVILLIRDDKILVGFPWDYAFHERILIALSLMVLPQLIFAMLSLCRGYSSILSIVSHPSLILLPVFTFFTFTTSPHHHLLCCSKKPREGQDFQINFSQSWTLANIVLNILIGLAMIPLGEHYFTIIVFSTLGTIIYLLLDTDCCTENCCSCLPAPQVSILQPTDPHTEFVVVEDNCGKKSVVTVEQWREISQENWRNMELHDYQEDEREDQVNSAMELEVLSELQRRP